MPFAGLVGDDVAGNFMRCTMKSFQDYAGFIMDPIQQLFGTFLQMFGSIAETLQNLRKAFAGIRKGFLGIVTMVFGKLMNSLSSMQFLMLKIRTVFMRITAVVGALMNIMDTGVSTGKSVMAGPIGQTMSFLCFDPATPMKLATGRALTMGELAVGDVLEDGTSITGVYRVSGFFADLYDYYGVRVTGSHRLASGTPVAEAPEAVLLDERLPELVCFDTDTGLLRVGGIEFRDFEAGEAYQHGIRFVPLGETVGDEQPETVVGVRHRATGWEVLVMED
jgi:hypothetical protein